MKKNILLLIVVFVLTSCGFFKNTDVKNNGETKSGVIDNIGNNDEKIDTGELKFGETSSGKVKYSQTGSVDIKKLELEMEKNTKKLVNANSLIDIVKEKYEDKQVNFGDFSLSSEKEHNLVEVLEGINLCVLNFDKNLDIFFENNYLSITNSQYLDELEEKFKNNKGNMCHKNTISYFKDKSKCQDKDFMKSTNGSFSYYYRLIDDEKYIKILDDLIKREKKEIKGTEYKTTEGIYLSNFLKKRIKNEINNKEDCYVLYNSLIEN